jgi:hypothetical protein
MLYLRRQNALLSWCLGHTQEMEDTVMSFPSERAPENGGRSCGPLVREALHHFPSCGFLLLFKGSEHSISHVAFCFMLVAQKANNIHVPVGKCKDANLQKICFLLLYFRVSEVVFLNEICVVVLQMRGKGCKFQAYL